ncbi:MAG TPA: Spy/CpxP family protein refolding chaperone [Acidobacteriaceae bacterium]|nr:Spy/CpxP family protein refolding chaperone [Acidobacteriaceae bacterium]
MKLSLALIAVLGLLPMAQAQTPPAHVPPSPATIAQHEVQRYNTLLTLTPAQVEQATTIFTTEATTRQNSWAAEKAAHQALEAAITSNDTATIQSTAASLGQMQGEMLAAHALARAQFYAILSSDQKTKYGQLEQEHMMGGPGRGPMMR